MLDIPEMESPNNWICRAIDNVRETGLRNMSVTTIAPTGTISQIAETSSGVEPNFSFAYTRWMTNNLGSKIKLDVVHRAIPEEYMERVLEGESLYEITGNPVHMSAMEISPEDHLLMQAYAQAYTTNSISKTVNMPNDATVEDVERVYKLAMMLGVKGVTVYRDGSLAFQVLETPKKKEKKALEFIVAPGPPVDATLQKILDKAYGNPDDSEWKETARGFFADQYGNTKCHVCGGINTIHMMEGCMHCQCGFGGCSV